MKIHCLGRPWIRAEGSAKLARKTSRRGERSSKAAPQEIYHRETQRGPFSDSERQIALQESSVERLERAFSEFCRKVQEEDCNDQGHREDEVQKRNEPSLRSKPKVEVTQEEQK